MQLRRSRLKFSHINNIFITHLHGDHCFGLLGLISTFALLGRTATLHIWGPKGIASVFQPQVDFFCQGMEYDVEFHEVDHNSSALIFEDRSVTVTTIPLRHRIPCVGYLFREKELPRHIRRDAIEAFGIPHCYINNIKAGLDFTMPDGEIIPNHLLTTPADPVRSYAYCSDTMFARDNAEIIKNVDLLYHEATFTEEHKLLAAKTYHSTAKQAAEMAKLCEAGKLIIGHFSSRYNNENILLEEAKSVFPNTIAAKERLTVSL